MEDVVDFGVYFFGFGIDNLDGVEDGGGIDGVEVEVVVGEGDIIMFCFDDKREV